MTGLFADTAVNPGGSDGAFYGRPIQMWYQLAGILTAIGRNRQREKNIVRDLCLFFKVLALFAQLEF